MLDFQYNILVFRTIRVTDFGFVINKIKLKFPNSKITILTKQQNIDLIKLIDGVDEVIPYENEPIIFKKFNKNDIHNIKSKKFNLIIIPNNGIIEAYDNVVNFTKKIFGNQKIIYFNLPDNFIEYKQNYKRKILKLIYKYISIILTIPIFIIYILILILSSFNRLLLNK